MSSFYAADEIETRIAAIEAEAQANKASTDDCWFCEALATALLAILDHTPAEIYAVIDRRLTEIAARWGCGEASEDLG